MDTDPATAPAAVPTHKGAAEIRRLAREEGRRKGCMEAYSHMVSLIDAQIEELRRQRKYYVALAAGISPLTALERGADTGIECLKLDARTYRALVDSDYETVGQLLELPDRAAIRGKGLWNFGQRALREVDEALARIGLRRTVKQ